MLNRKRASPQLAGADATPGVLSGESQDKLPGQHHGAEWGWGSALAGPPSSMHSEPIRLPHEASFDV